MGNGVCPEAKGIIVLVVLMLLVLVLIMLLAVVGMVVQLLRPVLLLQLLMGSRKTSISHNCTTCNMCAVMLKMPFVHFEVMILIVHGNKCWSKWVKEREPFLNLSCQLPWVPTQHVQCMLIAMTVQWE